MPMAELRGIVTGSARGIGASCVELLAERGADVLGVDRLAVDRHGFRELDLAQPGAAAQLAAWAAADLGAVDFVVCNAGIGRRAPLTGLDGPALREVLELNLLSVVEVIRELLPLLADRASIVVISSIRARRGFAEDAAYIASKGALEALVRALAVELGPRGIRVNAVAPGSIRTDMNAQALADETFAAEVEQRIPLRRIGTPREVAEAVAFLCSPASGFISGTVLDVDGGQLVQG